MCSGKDEKTKHQYALKQFHSASVLVTGRRRECSGRDPDLHYIGAHLRCRLLCPQRFTALVVLVRMVSVEALHESLSAGLSTFLCVCIMHPLDFQCTKKAGKVRKV